MDERNQESKSSLPLNNGRARREQTLNALADLYLSGMEATGIGKDDTFNSDVELRTAESAITDHARQSDRPVRLSPKIETLAIPGGQGGEDSRAESLPGPFPFKHRKANSTVTLPDVGDEAQEAMSQVNSADTDEFLEHRSAAKDAEIEAVLLGNLPGFGGPWLAQYAHHLATQHGELVGLVQIGGCQLDISIVSSAASLAESDHEFASPTRPVKRTVNDTLASLRQSESGVPRRWLVSVPVPATHQTCQVASSVSQWTLLCGADDAAVVGAYRLLKQVVGITSSSDDSTDIERQVSLMVMGADEPASKATANKLNLTAGSFLSTPVRLAGSRKRMEPIRQDHLGHWEMEEDEVWPSIEGAIAELSQGGKHDFDAAATARPIDEMLDRHRDVTTDDGSDAPGQGWRADRRQPELRDREIPSHLHASPRRPGRISWRNRSRRDGTKYDGASECEAAPVKPSVSPEPFVRNDRSTDVEVNLGNFLSAQVLDARCPDWPEAQLALDSNGRLHICLYTPQVDVANDGLAHTLPLHESIVKLMQVGQWVQKHLDLIHLTAPHLHFQSQSETVLHLFTRQSKAAASMSSSWEDQLKMHVLQQVRVGDTTTWCCIDLN